ncbi:Protein of unknown function [Pyronema omphalodes CBS 100304]|uniref:Uncharacterized protein n=1 Tax=Pyronema omphalodes (strain CBS 100304) TaxID=1076935 RepID=U4LTK5_PYROM|nr:Protein of unknown function [Pyronema omphalodes CBS 100304]
MRLGEKAWVSPNRSSMYYLGKNFPGDCYVPVPVQDFLEDLLV